MARKKKEDAAAAPVKPEPGHTGVHSDVISKLIKKVSQKKATEGDPERRVMRASDSLAGARWLDFVNPGRANRPSIAMEWLFGARGLLVGRVYTCDGEEHAGKSALLYYLYGTAQRSAQAIVQHMESEGSFAPPDFVWSLGADADAIIFEKPANVHQCVRAQVEWAKDLREEIPNCVTVLGLDSVSNLKGTSEQKTEHSLAFSQFFRDNVNDFADNGIVYIATSQLKKHISMDRFAADKHKQTTSLAEGAFKFNASVRVRVTHSQLKVKEEVVGEVVTLKTEKNKLNTYRRVIKPHLYAEPVNNGSRWDFDDCDITVLFDPKLGAFDPAEIVVGGTGGRYGHMRILDGKSMYKKAFLDAFYDKPELVQEVRERLRIRGFGFDFETNFKLPLADTGAAEEE